MTNGLLPGDMRPLPFPLQDTEQLETETPDDGSDPSGVFVWPEDSDERVAVTFEMSLNEFVILASAIDIGSDIGFGEKSTYVWWLWTRRLLTMPFCAQVIDCLRNDQDTKDALAETLAEEGSPRHAIEEITRAGSPLTPAETGGKLVDGCDLDALFAGITSIVDTMHRNNKDFLDIMNLAASQTDRLSKVISAIPVIGALLPVDEIVSWVGKMQAEVALNYDAEWDDSVRDAYRCGLFCIARSHDDCGLSYADINAFIQARLGAALDPLHLLESLVQYTILGTWSGTTVVDIMMLNQINIWAVAGQWLGSVLRTLESVAALGSDTPDPDWMILCTDCPAEPRWAMTTGVPASFPGQTLTFIEAQGDWDLWEVNAVNCPETFVFDNGQTYTHGYNVKRSDDGMFFADDDITDGNTAWCLYLRSNGSLENTRHFPGSVGVSLAIAQGNTTSNLTCRFLIKGV